MTKEAGLHFELYRCLQNAIEKSPEYYGVRYGKVVAEMAVDSGRADVVIQDDRGRPLVVIEAKRETKEGYDRNIDPYSPRVIEQAFRYAGHLGAPYFATFNGAYLVLWSTFEMGVHLLDRKSRAYRVRDTKVFAAEFLEQVAAIKTGKLNWEPDPKAFVNRLRVFHERLASEMVGYVVSPTSLFKKVYIDWATKQGWEVKEQDTGLRFSRQAAYLLMNKLLFYKILEDTGHDVPKLALHDLADPVKRREGFRRLTEKVDFQAVYEHDPVFDSIPLSKRASLEVEEFLDELEKYDLDRFHYDTIGHIYEDIVPPQERHDLGQFYTPPEIVELIARMTIRDPSDKVLDPACGSGSFLIRAYHHLKALKQQQSLPDNHGDILSQLFGFDINRFPAHLSAINLALQSPKAETREVNLVVEDFFNIRPDQDRLFTERVSIRKPASSKLYEVVPTGRTQVDVVMANPPYIRQEKIADKVKCREHLKRIGYEFLSERSDIYVYFFTHSTEFLKEGGRMGFITSDKWLTAEYGEGLQRFFLDNFLVRCIISFGHRMFDVALVPTCVIILEKCSSKPQRDSNTTTFLRVRTPMKIDELIGLATGGEEAGTLIDHGQYRLIALAQSELSSTNRWSHFLYAPTIYWQILTHEKMCTLKDVASVSRGKTSGANDFFYMTDGEAESWGIEAEFLKPVVKSIRQATAVEFRRVQTDTLVLDLQGYIKYVLEQGEEERIRGASLDSSTLPADAALMDLSAEEVYVLSRMLQDGHRGLYNYIVHSMWEKDWGRDQPPQKRSTCLQNRQRNHCWFNLGSLKTPALFAAKGYWDRVFFPLNVDRVVIDCRLYEVYTDHEDVLAGILNSSLSRLLREVHSRTTGGGMSELMVYEFENMPVLDPRRLSAKQKDRICTEFRNMIASGSIQSEDLDRSVLAPLGLETRVREIAALAEALSEARRKGKEANVMIEGIEGARMKIGKLKGAELVSRSDQARLTDF